MTMSLDLLVRMKAAGLAGGRVYRDERLPGSALPAVRSTVTSDPQPSTMDGRQALRETGVQHDCMALTRDEADALAEAVIVATETAGIHGATKFSRSFVDASRSYSERDAKGVVTYVTSLDMRVWHSPAA
jgi:hypothetical protein